MFFPLFSSLFEIILLFILSNLNIEDLEFLSIYRENGGKEKTYLFLYKYVIVFKARRENLK